MLAVNEDNSQTNNGFITTAFCGIDLKLTLWDKIPLGLVCFGLGFSIENLTFKGALNVFDFNHYCPVKSRTKSIG